MSAPLELVIGVDVGGTKTRAGVIDREGTIHNRLEAESPETSEEAVLATLDSAVEGLLDDFDLVAHARSRFGLPVAIENDANAAALAEWKLGAGKGVSNLVMLTLGTGVGGGLVLDGQLYRGWAELGHVVLQTDGPPCQGNCHGHGHVEALVSGTAADAVARELYGGGADAHVLVERAHAGEEEARARLAAIGEILGAAIGSLANIFDPELVVVGGGFGDAAGDLLLVPAQEAGRRQALAPADVTLRVVPAELGSDAGLVGAGLIAFEALDGTR